MTEIFESLLKRTHLAVMILGVLVVLIGCLETIPWYGQDIPIHGPSRYILWVVGILVLMIGVAGWRFKLRHESVTAGKDQGTSAMLKHEPTDGESTKKIRCNGTLKDLYLGESEKIVEMPQQRRWNYELRDIEIKIYKDVLRLEFEALIKSPHSDIPEVYKSCGSGPFIDGVGFLTYSFNEVDGGSAAWDGVMILRVPSRGKINGFWLTTNVNRDDKFPIGTITLTRRK